MRKGAKGYIYIDGGSPDAVASGTPRELRSTISVCIGADQRDGCNYFAGDIDDIAIWNRALFSSEIQQIYVAGLFGKTFRIIVDGSHGLNDFANLARWWLKTECRMCGGVDLNNDNSIDLNDLILFSNDWLKEK
jgi:hypothetical protein